MRDLAGAALTRRLALLATALLAFSFTPLRAQETPAPVPAEAAAAAKQPPIVFVHGNGDSQAAWITQIWRFESNGYPRNRLFAIDLRYPNARSVDAVEQPGRSSTEDVKNQLSAFVDDVLARTGARKVVLVGNSRGANTIRNYVKNGGGAVLTAKVILGGGVNHGVLSSDTALVGSEFNGRSPFLQQLNAGPNEVVPGVDFFTLRSDRFDLYAQPTGVGYDGPALNGARNIVLPGVDHRETSYSPRSFAKTYRFITGKDPKTLKIREERNPVLSGKVTGVTAGAYDNIGVPGVGLEIYRLSPSNGARIGGPAYAVTTGEGGAWGPFKAKPDAVYEFAFTVPGQPPTRIVRSPFPRGASVITLRPATTAQASATESTIVLIRPRGYFGFNDKVRFAGAKPAVIPDAPVPTVTTIVERLPPTPDVAVTTRFEQETIRVRKPPAGTVTFAEFHY